MFQSPGWRNVRTRPWPRVTVARGSNWFKQDRRRAERGPDSCLREHGIRAVLPFLGKPSHGREYSDGKSRRGFDYRKERIWALGAVKTPTFVGRGNSTLKTLDLQTKTVNFFWRAQPIPYLPKIPIGVRFQRFSLKRPKAMKHILHIPGLACSLLSRPSPG